MSSDASKQNHTLMHIKFNRRYLLLLAVTAFPCSRTVFAFLNDPEGPNLLVVTALAAVIFVISSAAYLSNVCASLTGFKRALAAILIQIFAATGFYFAMR